MSAPLFQPSDVPITVVTPATRTPFTRYSIVRINPPLHGCRKTHESHRGTGDRRQRDRRSSRSPCGSTSGDGRYWQAGADTLRTTPLHGRGRVHGRMPTRMSQGTCRIVATTRRLAVGYLHLFRCHAKRPHLGRPCRYSRRLPPAATAHRFRESISHRPCTSDHRDGAHGSGLCGASLATVAQALSPSSPHPPPSSFPPLRFDPVAQPLVAVAFPRDVLELLDVQFLPDLLERALLHLGGGFVRALRRLGQQRVDPLHLPRRNTVCRCGCGRARRVGRELVVGLSPPRRILCPLIRAGLPLDLFGAVRFRIVARG